MSQGFVYRNSSDSILLQYVNDCTPATKGMLHLDPATSLIYKCDGYDWLSLEDEFRAAKSTAPSTTTERPTEESVEKLISASECLPGKNNFFLHSVFLIPMKNSVGMHFTMASNRTTFYCKMFTLEFCNQNCHFTDAALL
jgi:hypothetical protein